MNSRTLFWAPALVRLISIIVGALILGYFTHILWGALFIIVAFFILIYVQLYYLFRLSLWLDNPRDHPLLDGWGVWTEIFSRLYRLRREDEKNQLELSEWLTRFRQAMTLLPDGVVIMDHVLLLEWCNPVAEIHFGLNPNKDKDMRITNLIRSPEFINYIIMGRFEKPLIITHRDRKLVVHMIQFENRRQILVTHDITENERIDCMRRDFIANASHELKTPLTVINGFLEIAATQPNLDSQTRANHIKLMIEQGQRMEKLVEDMLTLTRLESMDFLLRPEKILVSSMLAQIILEMQAISLGKHTIHWINEGVTCVMGGAEELRSAFTNLILNAIRYTPEKGVITVKWTINEKGPLFQVQDTGIGIDVEHIARLTERFYRVDKSRSRQLQGTGLGLSIVKHVVLRHHAQLLIESIPHLGSTFSIQFPLSIQIIES